MKITASGVAPALLLLAAPALMHAAPVELGRESFETAPGIGYTTSVAEFDEPTIPNTDYFGKFPNDGVRVRGIISGADGAAIFAAEDIDTVPGPGVGAMQFLTTSAFSIAGKTSTSVKVLLAAPGNGPNAPNSQSFYDHSTTASEVDFVRVEASVDGGPFNRLIQFSPTVPSTVSLNSPLGLDSDGDGLADTGTANLLTSAFREFDLPFSTGNSVQIRVVMHTNATNEPIAVDNVRIFGDTSATAAPVLAGVPATVLTFVEGSAAQQLAPAITVTDADSANLAAATVTLSAGYVNGEDVLSATPSGAIVAGDIVFNAGTGTLTITRSATKATYQTVLRSVAYRNTNTTSPSTGERQVRFSVNDGANPSNQPIRTVQVTDALVTQNVPFTESFETDGRGSRYALDGRFTISPTSYFDRQTSVTGVTNLDGTSAVVAEDTANSGAPVNAVNILCNGSGFSTLYASVRLGAPGGSVYDAGDLITVEYSAGGLAGPWVAAGIFRSTTGFGSPMALDRDGDGVGDGAQLSAAMKDFTFILPAASTFGFRVRCASNVAGERLVVDKISLSGSNGLSNLVAYWNFDTEITNGMAVDSRAGLAARLLGGAAQTAASGGRSGLATDRAMHFGTGAQRLHVPAPDAGYFTGVAAGDRISVSFWVRQTQRNATPIWLTAPAATGGGRGLSAHTPWGDNNIYFDTAGCCGATDTRTMVAVPGVTWTDWHHVALVKDLSTKKIYLDGNLLQTTTNTSSLALTITELFLGNSAALTDPLDGDMDEVAIYGSALSAGEVGLLATLTPADLPTTPNDTDADSLPDKWETRFAAGLGVLTGPTADPDGDGMTNAEELANGFDPTVANFLLVTSAADSGPGTLREAVATALLPTGANLIRFDPAVFNGEPADTIPLATEIVISAPKVIIDASTIPAGVRLDPGAGTNRHFTVNAGAGLNLLGLTLTGGDGSGTSGGSILCNGALTLVRCTVSGNTSPFGGGGIACLGAASVLTMENSTVTGNTALFAGGVWCDQTTSSLLHCTVVRNTATSGTGGMVAGNGSTIFTNTILAQNTGTADPDLGGSGSVLTLNGNSIIGQNTGLYTASLPAGTPNANGDFIGTAAAPVNPRLAPLANYGGPTPLLALLPGSPALDAGAAFVSPVTDQRGLYRSRDGNAVAGALPDIGAYEAQSLPFALGLNLQDVGVSGGDTMAATEIAGAPGFEQGHWNGLAGSVNSGGTAPDTSTRNSAGGVPVSGLKVWWKGPNTWRVPGAADTPDKKLMFGYLDSNFSGDDTFAADLFNSPAAQPYVALAGLPAASLLGGYKAVAYFDGDAADGRVGRYWLTSNRTQSMTEPGKERPITTAIISRDAANFSGTYVRGTTSDDTGATTPPGNYAVFENLTEPSGFIFRAEEGSVPASNGRAPINAVQVVRNEIIVVTTAADELDPIGTIGTGISLREAVRDAAPGTGIIFDPAVFNGQPADVITISPANPEFLIARNLTIDASDISGGVTVNAAAGVSTPKRVFRVSAGAAVSFLGLTITGGYVAGGFDSVLHTGGGLLNQGRATLVGCTLSGNTATYGAAVNSLSNVGATQLTLRRCAVSGNNATSNGGGLLNWTAGFSGEMRVEECTVSGNTATSFCAGVYTFGGTGIANTIIQQTTISGNTAAVATGCLNWSSGSNTSTSLLQSTVTDNTASTNTGGSGLYLQQGLSANVTLFNTIVAGNRCPAAPDRADIYRPSGTILSVGGNLIGIADGATTTWMASDLTGTLASPRLPLLSPLGSYGGPLQTVTLLPGSPARNAGVAGTGHLSLFPADQRGLPRTLGAATDIGAVETGTAATCEGYLWETLPATATLAQHANTADYDQDGVNNETEWLALTDPASALSAFRPAAVRSGGNLLISFPSVTGRSYRLLRSDTLAPGSWVDSGLAVITGNGTTRTFTVTVPALQRRFYQVAPFIP